MVVGLFTLCNNCSIVPDNFGSGLIIPLVKDKMGDVNSLDYYRGITLIPVVAKLSELVILELCSEYLVSDDLQFGFKPSVGCMDASFVFKSVIQYYSDKGGTVYAASLDISKAFDKVSHRKLLNILVDTGLPHVLICVISNWYSQLYVAVRWKGVISTSFHVCSGVQQGSTLSLSLFNVFINLLIVRLRHLGLGCHDGCHFVGCILYADDIILLSTSVTGLKTYVEVLL